MKMQLQTVLLLAVINMSVHSLPASSTIATRSRPIEKREIDTGFMRRYNHLQHEYKHNPLAFEFFKYFLRNRAQSRERRQVDYNTINRYYTINNSGLNKPTSGYLTINPNNGYYSNSNLVVANPYNFPNNNYVNMYSRYDQRIRQQQVPTQIVQQPQFIRYNQNNNNQQQRVGQQGSNNRNRNRGSNTTPTTSQNKKKHKRFRPPMVFF